MDSYHLDSTRVKPKPVLEIKKNLDHSVLKDLNLKIPVLLLDDTVPAERTIDRVGWFVFLSSFYFGTIPEKNVVSKKIKNAMKFLNLLLLVDRLNWVAYLDPSVALLLYKC